MSSKRDYSDLYDGEVPEPTPEPNPKRAKQQSSKSSRQHQNSGIDATWGQKYVFSNQDDETTIPYGEESDFEDDTEAMAYLASVRQEAYAIPHLLVAPKVQIGPQLPTELQTSANDDEDATVDRTIYQTPMVDSRGWYQDGAYIARPEPEQGGQDGEALHENGVTEKNIHEAYFTSLFDQYNHLRQIVRTKPPPDATLPRSIPTYAASFDGDIRTTRFWSGILRKTNPHPLQVARLSKDSVLRILRIILGGKLLRQGYTIEERTSRWLWALLARLPDRGELDYSEIGWVRDLGRRAVLLGRSLSEMAALREELSEGQLGVHEGVDGSNSDDDILVDGDVDDAEAEDNDTPDPDTAPMSEVETDSRSQGINADDNPDEAITMGTHGDEGKDLDSNDNAKEDNLADDDEQEEGEIDEDEDVAMDLASNSSVDEEPITNLDEAKARLLGRLAEDETIEAKEAAKERSRMNMRATLNMILTVAGEFYGQRDLLEFREPFVGL